jgi:hypothetical protein
LIIDFENYKIIFLINSYLPYYTRTANHITINKQIICTK